MNISDEATFFTLLNNTIEEHGCKIASVDLDAHVINLEGPDEAVAACAEAIANLVDK